MTTVLLIVHLFVTLALIGVVLIQGSTAGHTGQSRERAGRA
jgi:preprotein translocase subunit SecG